MQPNPFLLWFSLWFGLRMFLTRCLFQILDLHILLTAGAHELHYYPCDMRQYAPLYVISLLIFHLMHLVFSGSLLVVSDYVCMIYYYWSSKSCPAYLERLFSGFQIRIISSLMVACCVWLCLAIYLLAGVLMLICWLACCLLCWWLMLLV
jgi:hypothetical protein